MGRWERVGPVVRDEKRLPSALPLAITLRETDMVSQALTRELCDTAVEGVWKRELLPKSLNVRLGAEDKVLEGLGSWEGLANGVGETAGVKEIAGVRDAEPLRVDRGSVAVGKGDGEIEMEEEEVVVGQYDGVKGPVGEEEMAGDSLANLGEGAREF